MSSAVKRSAQILPIKDWNKHLLTKSLTQHRRTRGALHADLSLFPGIIRKTDFAEMKGSLDVCLSAHPRGAEEMEGI